MRNEWIARWLMIGIALGLPLALLLARWLAPDRANWVEVRARMPEQGGFLPGDLTAVAGEPLNLRLASEDVLHGFAIGHSSEPGIDLYPGKVVETTITFDQPGRYTYYCTRWCGPNHWRMRGTIDVSGAANTKAPQEAPLYVTLGLNLDAPHPADVVPEQKPSAPRVEDLGLELPPGMLNRVYYQTHSPAEAWHDLRQHPVSDGLDEQQIWDLVARLWQANTTSERLAKAADLYAQNCAACHGEQGQGDGVMADDIAAGLMDAPNTGAAGGADGEHSDTTGHATLSGHETVAPTDFTDPKHMLGAQPALLHGKITRGGMGTGMPYWGPIFTEDEIWMLTEYLWQFQFDQ